MPKLNRSRRSTGWRDSRVKWAVMQLRRADRTPSFGPAAWALLAIVCALPSHAQAPRSGAPVPPDMSASKLGDTGVDLSGLTESNFRMLRGREIFRRDKPAAVREPEPTKWMPRAPFASVAKQLYDERIAAAEKGQPFRHLMTRCLPQGMPLASLFAFYPVQILQSAGQVAISMRSRITSGSSA